MRWPPQGGGEHRSASNRGRPAMTRRPSTTPWTPRPSRLAKSRTRGADRAGAGRPLRSPARSGARKLLECAGDPEGVVASVPSTRDLDQRHLPGGDRAGLVQHDRVDLRVDSSTSGPLMRIPSCAPRPVPTRSAVGVASPSAQGQAMISTATAAVNAAAGVSPLPTQNEGARRRARGRPERTRPRRWSASRWTGALPFWRR